MRHTGFFLAILCLCIAVAALLFPKATSLAMGEKNVFLESPEPRFPGKFVPWECALEADHAPPLPQEAHILFQEARGNLPLFSNSFK